MWTVGAQERTQKKTEGSYNLKKIIQENFSELKGTRIAQLKGSTSVQEQWLRTQNMFLFLYSVLVILREKGKRNLEECSSSHPAFLHPHHYVFLRLAQTTAWNLHPGNSLLVFLSLIRRAAGDWKHKDSILGIEE